MGRQHAKFMAEQCRVVCFFESALNSASLVDDIGMIEPDSSSSCSISGENEQCGESVMKMHLIGMRTNEIKKNILNTNYHKMGMGTATGCDGKLYMCQLFGEKRDE